MLAKNGYWHELLRAVGIDEVDGLMAAEMVMVKYAASDDGKEGQV